MRIHITLLLAVAVASTNAVGFRDVNGNAEERGRGFWESSKVHDYPLMEGAEEVQLSAAERALVDRRNQFQSEITHFLGYGQRERFVELTTTLQSLRNHGATFEEVNDINTFVGSLYNRFLNGNLNGIKEDEL